MHLNTPSLASVTSTIALALASSALAGGGKGSFHLLGASGLTPTDASRDGRVVVGYNTTQFWYWTPESGLNAIGGVSPWNGGAGSAGVDDLGTRVGYSVVNAQTSKIEGAFYNIAAAETTRIGSFGFSCDADATTCWGVSGDGNSMVGLAWHSACAARGYHFTVGGGLVDLGTSVAGRPTRANGTNFDGSTIAGWQDAISGERYGVVWRNGVQKPILTPSGLKVGEAAAVSGDGTWVTGLGSSNNNFLGWRWSEATGYIALPASPIPSLPRAFPTAMNDDGSRVLLFYRTQFPPATGGEGYMWIDGTLKPLETLAAEAGIALTPDIRMALPLGMSPDGYTIVGTARTASGIQGFILDLPRPASACPADFNKDGTVGAADLAALLSAWGTPSSPADLDGDGAVGATDLAALLSAWGTCD